jgi:cysteine desulfurase/selenocysteine lyase
MFDVESLRKDFPVLDKKVHGHPLVYLDTAATAQKPRSVIEIMTDFYTNWYGTVHRAVYELAVASSMAYTDTRRKVQHFLNARAEEEIIFTRGTTDSINTIAYSFGKAFIRPGDEILISETEHHANIVPWQLMCEDRGARLIVAPVNDRSELIMDEFCRLLSTKTKLVSIGHVSNSTGTIHPVKEITRLAHEKGAKVMIDGAQAVPTMPVDLQDIDCDFYAFSGHKVYGPTGVGVLYGKKELLEQLPPYQGGGDMIEQVSFDKTTYAPLPLKFEAGTPMIAEVIGLGAAIDYLEGLGMAAIHTHKQTLLAYGTSLLQEIKGLTLIGTAREKSTVLSFVVEGCHPLDIGTLLDLKGVAIRTGHHCSQPTMARFGVTGTARASLGLYTTKAELDQFAWALRGVLEKLR